MTPGSKPTPGNKDVSSSVSINLNSKKEKSLSSTVSSIPNPKKEELLQLDKYNKSYEEITASTTPGHPEQNCTGNLDFPGHLSESLIHPVASTSHMACLGTIAHDIGHQAYTMGNQAITSDCKLLCRTAIEPPVQPMCSNENSDRNSNSEWNFVSGRKSCTSLQAPVLCTGATQKHVACRLMYQEHVENPKQS